MKELSSNTKRVITGIAIVAVMIPCIIFMHTIVFPILLALISFFAVYEVEKAVGVKNPAVIAISCLTAAAIPFLFHFGISVPFLPVAIIYCIVYFILMVTMHEKTTFNDIAVSLVATISIPTSLSTLILMRDIYISNPDSFTKANGVYLVMLGFFAAWITDSCAYTVGRRIGKHKLCPKISPKKSVEGAVGGVIGAIILNLALFFVFDKKFFTVHTISWWQIIVISVLLSVISMFGDLSASIIKRNHGIKDFGKILPGHGGMMDRFDSCLFVMPALYAAVYFLALRS